MAWGLLPFFDVEVPESLIEVSEDDILRTLSLDDARVRLTYRRINAFLGHFLGRMRRGQTLLCEAPLNAEPGDLVEVEVLVADQPPFVLHAEVVELYLGQAELRFVTGPLADRVVAPLVERALGEHARELLGLG